MKSVHFPPTSAVVRTEPRRKNPYDAYRDACADAKLIVDTLKTFLVAQNRHGDLQVVRSAARRIDENATAMLEVEEHE